MLRRVFFTSATVIAMAGMLSACSANTKIVMVKSTPEGADVKLAGKTIGTTPVTDHEVSFGDNESIKLEVEKPWYLSYITNIENDGKEQETINAVLVKVADVKVESSSPAGVMVNGKTVGITPLQYRLVFDKSEHIMMTLKADGYRDFQQTFTINGPDTYSLRAKLEPVAHTESIFFDTDPQGATITMGLEYFCDTPCRIHIDDMDPSAKHQLKVEHRGFSPRLINLEYMGNSWQDRNYPKKMKILLSPAAGNEAYGARTAGVAPTDTSGAPMIIAPVPGGSQVPVQHGYNPQQVQTDYMAPRQKRYVVPSQQ